MLQNPGGGGNFRNMWAQHARKRFMPQRPGQPAPPPGAPPVGAPPVGAPPVGGQIPGQGIYLQRQGQAEQAYQQALAQIAQRKQQTFRDYGFLENGQVDPNASHGQIQELWRGQAQTANQSDLGLLGRGIRGGLAGQQNTMLKQQEGGQNLQLQNNYTNAMQELADARTGADSTRAAAMLEAQQEAEQAALQGQQYTPAAAPGEEDDGPGEPHPLPGRATAKKHLAKAMAHKRPKKKKGR